MLFHIAYIRILFQRCERPYSIQVGKYQQKKKKEKKNVNKIDL